MTKRDAEKSRSDDIVKPGASAPGNEIEREPQSPAGATSESSQEDVAPAGLCPGDADRSPGADAPGYTISPVPGLESSSPKSPQGATAHLVSSAGAFDRPCTALEAALVDYSDSDLSPQQAQSVATHLNQCPRCQTRVAALRASLSIAQDIWRDSAAAEIDILPPASRFRWQPVAALAGTAAALLMAVLWMTTADLQPDRLPRPLDSLAKNQSPPMVSAELPAEWEDLEAIISRQVRSARLAAAARVLANDPELKPYHDSAQRYLAEAFGAGEDVGRSR